MEQQNLRNKENMSIKVRSDKNMLVESNIQTPTKGDHELHKFIVCCLTPNIIFNKLASLKKKPGEVNITIFK